MIALLFLGIILGLVVSPLVEYVLLRILAHKKPKPPVYRTVHRPTEKQKKLLNASTQACKDMNWFNIALQRFFLELSQSYAFKDKLKKTLLKKIKSVSKVIKISIDEIDFGTECPVLSNIRVLSENEIVKIAQSYKAAKFKTENIDDELAKDISKIETEGSEEKSTSEIEYEPSVIIEDETNEPIPLQCEEDQIDFDNIKYYFEMEYSGNYRVKATVKLPGIKTVPVSFTLHYLKGPIILRLPAKLNHTRFEFSILNIDRLEFRIESDLMNKYIKKTVSNMMHKFFVLFFKGTYVYPNFYTQYLPNVIPSMREIIYPYKNIRSEDEALECFEFLLIVMSMDFRMTKVIEGIIFRRTNYYVNNSKKRVLMCDFNIKNSIKQYGEGTDINETTKYIDDALVESFFKCMILELEIFKDCITNFKGVELVSEYNNYARVNLHFDDSIYPFNRFVNKDCVIFQSDSSNEFFAFRIRSLQVFEIIFYTQNKDYTINERRIQGIRDKIEGCSLSSIKEMNKQGISGLKNSKDIINDNNKFDFILELYNAILNENIDVFDGTNLKTKDINIGDKTDILYEMIIKDISIRLKLIYDTFTVLETTGIDEFIETKVLHKGCHKKVLSLIKNNIVIDVIDKKHLICFNLDNRTVKLYYNEQIVSSRYHSFIYTTKLLERIYNYKNDSNPLFVSQLNEHKFERDFKVKNTSFCVELTVSCNDEMYFYIYNRTTRKYLIERLKISGNKNKLTRVIVPISKPSTIMVHVKSKEGYLDNSLKIYTNDNEEYLNEKMIQTQIELSKKKRFEMNFDGQPDYSLYWDFSESALACYMNDGSAVNVSGTGFNLVSKKKYSIHMLSKNKQKLGMEMNVGMFKIIN